MPLLKTEGSHEMSRFLRRRQSELDLTQAEISQRICALGYEVSPETVSRWIRHGAIPPLRDTKLGPIIARAFEVELSVLRRLSGDFDLMPVELGAIVNSLPVYLLDLLDRATPEQIELITRIVCVIVEEH